MNTSIQLFNSSGGPTGTGKCSDEDIKSGKCDPQIDYATMDPGFIGNSGAQQSGSYFPGASVHKGALYAHKARHKIR